MKRMGPNFELALDSDERPSPNTSKIGHFNFFSRKTFPGEFFQNIFSVGLMGDFAHFRNF
jgi:hypothetical protein